MTSTFHPALLIDVEGSIIVSRSLQFNRATRKRYSVAWCCGSYQYQPIFFNGLRRLGSAVFAIKAIHASIIFGLSN